MCMLTVYNTSSNSVHIYLYIAFGLHARRCRCCWIPGPFGPFDFITSTYCVSTHVCVPGADFYNNDNSMRPMRVCFPKHLGINQQHRLNSLTSIGKLRGKRAVKGDKKRRMEKQNKKAIERQRVRWKMENIKAQKYKQRRENARKNRKITTRVVEQLLHTNDKTKNGRESKASFAI